MALQRNDIADFSVQNEFTIYLLHPHTDAAREWLKENILGHEQQYFGNSLVVEHRYIADIVAGIQADGLDVR